MPSAPAARVSLTARSGSGSVRSSPTVSLNRTGPRAPAPATTPSSITRICVPARRCTSSSRRSGRRSSPSRRRSAKSSGGTTSPTRRARTSQTSCRRSAGSCSPSTCASTKSPTRAGLRPTSPISGSGATATSSWRWITPARLLTRWSSCDRPSRPSSRTAPRGAKASRSAKLLWTCPVSVDT